MVATLTLTAHSDDAPTPRIDVLLENLDATCATVTVYQITDTTKIAVRDAIKASAASQTFFVSDYEAPLGIPVSYQAMQYTTAGAEIGLTPIGASQLDIDDSSMVVVQDPLAPSRSVRVQAKASFGQVYARQRDMALVRRGSATVALMGDVGLGESIPLQVQTKTVADAVALADVLEVGDVLVRSMPGFHMLPGNLYCVVPKFSPVGQDVSFGGDWVIWPIEASEVTRTTIGIIEPVITYARFAATYSTYSAAKAVYSTYLEAKRNPPPEV